MLDTTPVTTEITRLISTGTTEEALLAAVAHLFPKSEPGRAVSGPAGGDDRGGAAGDQESLMSEKEGVLRMQQSGRWAIFRPGARAEIRARIDDFKRNGLHTRVAQEILETLEGTLEVAQRQRDIIARPVEMGTRQDGMRPLRLRRTGPGYRVSRIRSAASTIAARSFLLASSVDPPELASGEAGTKCDNSIRKPSAWRMIVVSVA